METNDRKCVALKIAQIIKVTHDTNIYRFYLPHNREFGLPLCGHVFFKADLPDKDGNKDLVIRKYTPVSWLREKGQVDFLIKIYRPNEQFPEGGQMTKYLDTLKVGDSVEMEGPKGKLTYTGRGNFYIGKRYVVKSKIGLIAGGSGITPIYSLIQAICKNKDKQVHISLIFGNKSEDDILLKDELDALHEQNPDVFDLHYIIDKSLNPKDWNHHTGYVTTEILKELLPAPSKDTLILTCGPPPMTNSVKKGLFEDLDYDEETMFHKF